MTARALHTQSSPAPGRSFLREDERRAYQRWDSKFEPPVPLSTSTMPTELPPSV